MSSRRIAIVAGAAQGIGRAIALRLARDGLDIAVSDLASKRTALEAVVQDIRAHGRNAIGVQADVAVEDDVNTMVETVKDKLGGLDVMVANAGKGVYKTILDLTLTEFDSTLSVNTRGVLLCYKAAAKAMIEQNRGGRIIGACSVLGKLGLPGTGAYCASKFAVRGLTQVAASELGRYGITVNAYAPGATETPLLHAVLPNVDPSFNVQQLAGRTALGRLGEPDDIANLVSFLASKDSAFMTGQTVTADGGLWFD